MPTAVKLGEPYLPTQTIADFLEVDPRTVRQWIADGRLRAIRVGRQLRVEPSEFRRFIADSAEPAQGGDAA